VRPVQRIEYGVTVWVESIEAHLGGMGRTLPYALATLVFRCDLRGAVGPDDFGDRVLARLQGAGRESRRRHADGAADRVDCGASGARRVALVSACTGCQPRGVFDAGGVRSRAGSFSSGEYFLFAEDARDWRGDIGSRASEAGWTNIARYRATTRAANGWVYWSRVSTASDAVCE